ncbi:MAG: hypothetical protein IPF54_11590 [Draconibacterium sp.]|nr:hypothetical protein [Draconibacterium sp.]
MNEFSVKYILYLPECGLQPNQKIRQVFHDLTVIATKGSVLFVSSLVIVPVCELGLPLTYPAPGLTVK